MRLISVEERKALALEAQALLLSIENFRSKANLDDWESCLYFNPQVIGDDSFQNLKNSVDFFVEKYFQTPNYTLSLWE